MKKRIIFIKDMRFLNLQFKKNFFNGLFKRPFIYFQKMNENKYQKYKRNNSKHITKCLGGIQKVF